MQNYMAIIFISFGILKLYDLKGFVEIFSKYDLISKNIKVYGYFYPFFEIILGLFIFLNFHLNKSLIVSVILMTISLLSVIISIYNGKNLRCGCMGSFFNIPLSYTTLSENIFMLLMNLIFINK